MIRFNHGGKHDEVRFDDLVCDRVVWVDDGETDVPMISFVWNFRSCPVWFVCKSYAFEEGVGVLDFFQKLFLGPKLAHVHGITVEFFVGDRPAWNLSID